MKKRILALALAGTTAFSMFGGLNVFAAPGTKADEAFTKYVPNTTLTNITATTADDLNDEVTAIYTGSASIDLDITSGIVYLFDFAVRGAKDGKLDAATAGYDTGYDIKTALVTELGNAIQIDDDADVATATTKLNALITEFNAEYVAGGSNATIIASFNEITTLASKLVATDYEDLYDDDDNEWAAYNLADLKSEVARVKATLSTVSPARTSQLIYLYNAFNTIDSVIGLDRALSTEEKYSNLLDDIAEMIEEDYTATSWEALENKMTIADAYASIGDYDNAFSTLNSAVAALKVVKPSTTELKASLSALFVNGTIPSAYTTYAGNDANVYVYLLANNLTSGVASDAWKVAFADSYTTAYGETLTGAYKAAYDAYRNISKFNNSGKHTNTEVTELVEALDSAVAALSEGSEAANWELIRLEEVVEKADAVVETDYNTKRAAWKNFTAALEKAEATLDKTGPATTEVNRVRENLETTMAALSSIKLTPPAASKTTLKDLLKEADELLKTTDGKSLTQVDTLKSARTAGMTVYNTYSSSLISKVDSTIADLQVAIAGYKQAQGWYKNAAGKWMYGTGETYLANGWNKLGGTWYYFNADGTAKQSEWMQEDGTWYWFTSNCNAARGWAKVDGNWYYFNDGCKMMTGWVKVAGSWYYLAPSGKMMTGWVEVNGKWYYLSKEANAVGQMLANTTVDGYKLGADGAWVK